jgi:hypothetical protein
MNTNEKNEIANIVVSNENFLRSFFEIQQSDILSEVRKSMMEIFHKQVEEIAYENDLNLYWDNNFNLGSAAFFDFHFKEESKFGYSLSFGFLWSYNSFCYGIDSNQKPYIETHRRIVFDKLGAGLINFKKDYLTNWLWVGIFETPLDNWNNIDPWVAIQNGNFKKNIDIKIKDLLQIIKSFDNQL